MRVTRCFSHWSTAPMHLTEAIFSSLASRRFVRIAISRSKWRLVSRKTDFTLEVHAPVATVKCVTTPTPPRRPFAEGARSWRIINHLSLNYLSLLDHSDGDGAVALRDLLSLYSEPENAYLRKQIKGVRSVRTKQIVRRALTPALSHLREVSKSTSSSTKRVSKARAYFCSARFWNNFLRDMFRLIHSPKR